LDEHRATRVQSPFQRPRQPWILVAVVGAFLLVALIKPWSFGADGSGSGRSAIQEAVPSGSGRSIHDEPSIAPASTILDPNAMPCLTDATEQVVYIERWAGHQVQSWVAAPDVTVSGPLDAQLVPISIFSNHVVGLGICAPRDAIGVRQPAARFRDVESIIETPAGPRAIPLGNPDLITGDPSGPEPALLYGAPAVAASRASPGPARSGPPADPNPGRSTPVTPDPDTGSAPPVGDLAHWPTGSYAISFTFLSDGPAVVHWLRVDLIQGAGEPG
jgi:hypothetical protein